MAINRTLFFDTVRESLFGGSLSQDQVDGLTVLLDEGERLGLDHRQLAYVLATTYHETAQTIQPIAEYGKGEGYAYGEPDAETGEVYYGRGYVQLTWRDNYQKMCAPCAVDLVKEPDLAMDPANASTIIFHGMINGSFTGVCLGDYITEVVCDWYNARRIVNGTDRAADIADYAQTFYDALGFEVA